MEKMEIRLAALMDVEACLEIYNAQIEYETVHGDLTAWRRDVYPTRDDIQTGIAARDLYVVKKDSIVIACGRINYVQEPHYQFIKWQVKENNPDKILVLHTLAVAQKEKRNGVGKFFLDFYEAEGKRRGCTVLRFDTVSTNIPAQAFYKKYGYVECGRYSGEYMGRSDILYVCLEKVLG